MKQFNAHERLRRCGIDATRNRAAVLESIAGCRHAPSAREILARVRARRAINKVTLYRILDLLVEKKIICRNSTGDRSFRYCLGTAGTADSHCHFFCTRCGSMLCVDMESLPAGARDLIGLLSMHVDRVEIRLDGVCSACRGGPAG